MHLQQTYSYRGPKGTSWLYINPLVYQRARLALRVTTRGARRRLSVGPYLVNAFSPTGCPSESGKYKQRNGAGPSKDHDCDWFQNRCGLVAEMRIGDGPVVIMTGVFNVVRRPSRPAVKDFPPNCEKQTTRRHLSVSLQRLGQEKRGPLQGWLIMRASSAHIDLYRRQQQRYNSTIDE